MDVTQDNVKNYLHDAIKYWKSVEETHGDYEMQNMAKNYVNAYLEMNNIFFEKIDERKIIKDKIDDDLEKSVIKVLKSTIKNTIKFPQLVSSGLVAMDCNVWSDFAISYVLSKEPHLERKIFLTEDNKRSITQKDLGIILEVLKKYIGTSEELHNEVNQEWINDHGS